MKSISLLYYIYLLKFKIYFDIDSHKMLADRGFQRCISGETSFKLLTPKSLQKNEKRLPTKIANENRIITHGRNYK